MVRILRKGKGRAPLSPSPSGEGLGWGYVPQRPTNVLESLHPQAPPPRRRGLRSENQRVSAAASRALASTSSSEPLAIQLPPTQSTGSKASHSGALAGLMPPVGQNFAW